MEITREVIKDLLAVYSPPARRGQPGYARADRGLAAHRSGTRPPGRTGEAKRSASGACAAPDDREAGAGSDTAATALADDSVRHGDLRVDAAVQRRVQSSRLSRAAYRGRVRARGRRQASRPEPCFRQRSVARAVEIQIQADALGHHEPLPVEERKPSGTGANPTGRKAARPHADFGRHRRGP